MIMLKLAFRNQTRSAVRPALPALRVLTRRASLLFPRQTAAKTVSLVFVGAGESARLNGLYRQKKRPTNVLSFASQAPDELGDIIICPAAARREARAAGLSWNEHLSALVTHGLLHLLGFDHKAARAEQAMERLAAKILNKKTL